MMKKFITILCFGLAVAACSASETDEQIFARKCADLEKAELTELKAEAVSFACSMSEDEYYDIFSIEEKILILEIIEQTDLNDEEEIAKLLNSYPVLSEKIKCLQAMMIYGTNDKQLLDLCIKS